MSGQRRALSQPWAERAQADTRPADLRLTELARLLHPAVRWWWGPVKAYDHYYIRCYLCDAVISTMGSYSFLSERNRQHIFDHRQSESVRRLINQAVHAPGGTGSDGSSPEDR